MTCFILVSKNQSFQSHYETHIWIEFLYQFKSEVWSIPLTALFYDQFQLIMLLWQYSFVGLRQYFLQQTPLKSADLMFISQPLFKAHHNAHGKVRVFTSYFLHQHICINTLLQRLTSSWLILPKVGQWSSVRFTSSLTKSVSWLSVTYDIFLTSGKHTSS